MTQHVKIEQASATLVERIKETAAAKAAYDLAVSVLNRAENALRGAHAAEVEAHEEVRSALVERRKARRSL